MNILNTTTVEFPLSLTQVQGIFFSKNFCKNVHLSNSLSINNLRELKEVLSKNLESHFGYIRNTIITKSNIKEIYLYSGEKRTKITLL